MVKIVFCCINLCFIGYYLFLVIFSPLGILAFIKDVLKKYRSLTWHLKITILMTVVSLLFVSFSVFTAPLTGQVKQENEQMSFVSLPSRSAVVSRIPDPVPVQRNIGELKSESKISSDQASHKDIFLQTMLPITREAFSEIRHERARLLTLMNKADLSAVNRIKADEKNWQQNLSPVDVDFLLNLSRKYRSDHLLELLNRVDVFPVSLVLAQGAIESRWGTSRFAIEGNNFFGVWTWGDNGIVPLDREEGRSHKVAVYPSPLVSVRSYLLNLNRHWAYEELRNLRARTSDSLLLADGLKFYSERRGAYVDDVKLMLKTNDLKRFDNGALASHSL